ERASFSACLSVPTLDEKAWRATEPHTPHPRARLEAVAELNRAGIPTGVLVAPLMPGINDAPEQLEPLLKLAIEAGATRIGRVALSSGASPASTVPARSGRGATSISPRLRSIAVTTARATSSGERVPTPGGRLTSASANMPASRMNPGKTVDTPTPLERRSARSAAANPRRPYLVAL